MIVTFILIVFKKQVVNGYTVIVLAFVSCSVSVILMIISDYIADEVPSGGDPSSFYIFLIVLLLSMVNVMLVSVKR